MYSKSPKKFYVPLHILQVLVEIVLKLMGIYYKNYKRKQNWNENEQKLTQRENVT